LADNGPESKQADGNMANDPALVHNFNSKLSDEFKRTDTHTHTQRESLRKDDVWVDCGSG